jgi:hypothetical protein
MSAVIPQKGSPLWLLLPLLGPPTYTDQWCRNNNSWLVLRYLVPCSVIESPETACNSAVGILLRTAFLLLFQQEYSLHWAQHPLERLTPFLRKCVEQMPFPRRSVQIYIKICSQLRVTPLVVRVHWLVTLESFESVIFRGHFKNLWTQKFQLRRHNASTWISIAIAIGICQ